MIWTIWCTEYEWKSLEKPYNPINNILVQEIYYYYYYYYWNKSNQPSRLICLVDGVRSFFLEVAFVVFLAECWSFNIWGSSCSGISHALSRANLACPVLPKQRGPGSCFCWVRSWLLGAGWQQGPGLFSWWDRPAPLGASSLRVPPSLLLLLHSLSFHPL